jgi:hypothetical protein
VSRRTAAAMYDLAEAVRSGEMRRVSAGAIDRAADEHMRLVEERERVRAAVEKLQTAWWTADRPCDGDPLWTELRRAAGLER